MIYTTRILSLAVMLCISLFSSCTSDVDPLPPPPDEPSSSSLVITSGTFTDSRDSKSYKWVVIGTQTWMAENLNYEANGSKCYTNLEAYCGIYGRLYNWSTAMAIDSTYNSTSYSAGAKHTGVCPSGWHIPSDAEWGALMKFINPNCTLTGDCAFAGMLLKATIGWNSGNGTDAYGFAALPGGYGSSGGSISFKGIGTDGNWWSTNEVNSNNVYYRIAYDNSDNFVRYNGSNSKSGFRSIRCLQD
jgi:uncharacterized protein (TIGR02145 family)